MKKNIKINKLYFIPYVDNNNLLENKIYKIIYDKLQKDHTFDVNFLKNLKIISKKKITCPFISGKYKYKSYWSASFGYDRTETYTEYEEESYSYETYERGRKVTKWGKRTVPKTKTRILTDWKPGSGTHTGNGNSITYIGKYLKIESELINNILNNSKIFLAKTLKKNQNEFNKFDLIDKEIEESKLKKRLDVVTEDLIYANVKYANEKGDRSTDWSISTDFEILSIDKYQIPFLEASLSYKNKIYNIKLCVANSISDEELFGELDKDLPKDEKIINELRSATGYKLAGSGMFALITVLFLLNNSWVTNNPFQKIADMYLFPLLCVSMIYAAWTFYYYSKVTKQKIQNQSNNLKNIFKNLIHKK